MCKTSIYSKEEPQSKIKLLCSFRNYLVMKGLIITYKSKRLEIAQMILYRGQVEKIMKNPYYAACIVLKFLGTIIVLCLWEIILLTHNISNKYCMI